MASPQFDLAALQNLVNQRNPRPVVQNQDYGWLGNLLMGATSPIRSGLALASLPLQDTKKIAYGTPDFLQPTEWESLKQNPAAYGAGEALKGAAYMIPGIGPIADTAIMGGLAGLGQGIQEPNANLGSVVGSAALGAGAGALTGGAIKGLGALAERMGPFKQPYTGFNEEAAMQAARGEPVTAVSGTKMAAPAEQAPGFLEKVIQKAGEARKEAQFRQAGGQMVKEANPPSSFSRRASAADEGLTLLSKEDAKQGLNMRTAEMMKNEANDRAANLIPSIKVKTSSVEAQNALVDDVMRSSGSSEAETIAAINKRIEAITDKKINPIILDKNGNPRGIVTPLNSADLYTIKQETLNPRGYAKMLEKSNAGELKPEAAADFHLQGWSSSLLKGEGLAPDKISPAQTEFIRLSNISEAAHNILNQGVKQSNMSTQLYNISPGYVAGREVGRYYQGAKAKIAGAVEKGAGALSGASFPKNPAIAQGLNFLSTGVPRTALQYGVTQNVPQTAQAQQPVPGLNITGGQGMASQAPTGGDFASQLPFYLSLGMTPKEAYVQWIKDSQNQITGTQQKQLADLQNADAQLQQLEQAIREHSGYFGVVAGPVGGFINSISPDANRSALNTELQAVVQQTARGLEGGKLSDKDFARYVAYLPNMNDSPDAAISKIEALRKMVQSNLRGYQTQYGTETSNSDLSLLQ